MGLFDKAKKGLKKAGGAVKQAAQKTSSKVTKAAKAVKKGTAAVGLGGYAELYDVGKLARDPKKWATDTGNAFKSDAVRGLQIYNAATTGDYALVGKEAGAAVAELGGTAGIKASKGALSRLGESAGATAAAVESGNTAAAVKAATSTTPLKRYGDEIGQAAELTELGVAAVEGEEVMLDGIMKSAKKEAKKVANSAVSKAKSSAMKEADKLKAGALSKVDKKLSSVGLKGLGDIAGIKKSGQAPTKSAGVNVVITARPNRFFL